MHATITAWANVKIGDILNLKDEKTIVEVMKEKRGDFASGANLEVKDVLHFHLKGTNVHWRLFETDTQLVVLVKSVDDNFEVRVMFLPEGFPEGDRQHFVDSGFDWIFKRDNDELAKASFAEVITNGELEFPQKHPTLYPTIKGKLAAVKEWKCSNPEEENPELIIFELGLDGDDGRGGFLKFYQGTAVPSSDVSVFSI